jgi:hypothetical protein
MADLQISLLKDKSDSANEVLKLSLLILTALNLIIFSVCFTIVLVKTKR